MWINYYIYCLSEFALTTSVLCCNTILSYFIIAAMIESFKRVSQDLVNQTYLARAKRLFEYQLNFKRDKIFKNTRFILQAVVEKAEEEGTNSNWDGLSNSIVSNIKTSLEQEGDKTDSSLLFLKGKIEKLAAF